LKSDTRTLDVYLRHRRALINYAVPIVGCRARAEDLVQEAFIRYSARWPGGDPAAGAHGERSRAGAHSVSYLYRIVRNLAFDWIRRQDAFARTADAAALAGLATAPATPEQTALHREQVRVLAEALAELPPRTRTAFEMHRLEGRSFRDIADHLGVSAVRAHQLVKDAIRHAAARLDAPE
jgi:RNA polymerase sigma factor (sigma-70 family)